MRAPGWPASALPAGYDATNTRFFSGPNNLDRIPNIDLNGSTGTHFEISSWPWRNKADDYQLRDDVSITKGNHQIKFGASWAIYKKVQDLFGQTQGGFDFDGTFTGNDFADFLLGDAKSYQELAVQDKRHVEQRFLGCVCAGQLARKPQADPEPRSALGRRTAHLRSQQPDG